MAKVKRRSGVGIDLMENIVTEEFEKITISSFRPFGIEFEFGSFIDESEFGDKAEQTSVVEFFGKLRLEDIGPFIHRVHSRENARSEIGGYIVDGNILEGVGFGEKHNDESFKFGRIVGGNKFDAFREGPHDERGATSERQDQLAKRQDIFVLLASDRLVVFDVEKIQNANAIDTNPILRAQ